MSQSGIETEMYFFVKLGDFNGLEEADVIESHVQVEARFTTGNKSRVRTVKSVKGGPAEAGDRHIFTIKSPNEDGDTEAAKSSIETNIEVDENFTMAYGKVANQAFIKMRYYFTDRSSKAEIPELVLPPVCYEVDVFRDKDNNPIEWVKIDIELDDLVAALKSKGLELNQVKQRIDFSALPLNIVEVIPMVSPTPEQRSFVDSLYKDRITTILNPETFVEQKGSDPAMQDQNLLQATDGESNLQEQEDDTKVEDLQQEGNEDADDDVSEEETEMTGGDPKTDEE